MKGFERKIHLVRHGTPVSYNNGVSVNFAGRTDLPLCDRGREEAARTGEWLAEEADVKCRLYSSPLSRAYETAEIIRRCLHGCVEDIRVADDLLEMDFGICEGLPIEKIREMYPYESGMFMQDPLNTRMPQGESFRECGERFERAIERIVKENEDSGEDLIITAHACVIGSYLFMQGLIEPDIQLLTDVLPCASISTMIIGADGSIRSERIGWLPNC